MPEWPLDIDLEYMLVACAPFGGPVAITRDPMQIVPLKGPTKIYIRILNTAGEELAIIWVSLSAKEEENASLSPSLLVNLL